MPGFGASATEFLPVLHKQAPSPIAATGRISFISFELLLSALIEARVGIPYIQPVLDGLRSLGADDPDSLAVLDISAFASHWTGPSRKRMTDLGGTLKRFASSILAMGGMDLVEAASQESLRSAWLKIPGLGPSTVDHLLQLAGFPIIPIDRAIYRILVRHGWIAEEDGYEEAQNVILSAFSNDIATLQALAEAFSHIGKRWCKATNAACTACPLAPWLPESGKPYGSGAD